MTTSLSQPSTIGIYAFFAPSLDELQSELNEHMSFLWDAYACADDGLLTTDARKLKESILERVHASARC